MGIPTIWSNYIITTVLGLLPLMFLLPMPLSFLRKQESRKLGRPGLSLFGRSLCVLLAYTMLIQPVGLIQQAYASIDPGDAVFYAYDDNGSLIKKILAYANETDPDSNFEEKTLYTYNLQNRLAGVKVTTDGSNWDVTTYKYNPDGIRVEKNDNGTVTSYLIDSYNHTGYAQTLEEKTYNGTDTSGAPDSLTTYLIGDDVIAQSTDGSTQYLLYDGHGSTRQLAEYDGSVTITDSYSYDSYGIMLGGGRTTDTNLLYAGEYQDSGSQNYYLRARWYNPSNGRFNRPDPFYGSTVDPQSLHKYSYCAGNPVNNIDPLGLFTQAFGYVAEAAIQGVYASDHPGDSVVYGAWTRLGWIGGPAFRLKPDIFNKTEHTWLEIKPLSLSGVGRAITSFALYSTVLGFFGYSPEVNWIPSTHFVLAGAVEIFFFNAGGIVFYTDAVDNAEDLIVLVSIAAVREFLRSPAGQRIAVSAVGMLSRIPGLVKARIAIDRLRFEGHLSIGQVMASYGVL
jgi:RHS repeat-associated protein